MPTDRSGEPTTLRRGGRFAFTGLVCAALDLTVATLLSNALGLNVRLGLVGGYASGLLLAYIIHTVWTFRERAVPFGLGAASGFVLVAVVILGLRLGCLELYLRLPVTGALPPTILFALAAGTAQLVNFVLLTKTVFRKPRQ